MTVAVVPVAVIMKWLKSAPKKAHFSGPIICRMIVIKFSMKYHFLLSVSLIVLVNVGYGQITNTDSTQTMYSSQSTGSMQTIDSARLLKDQERVGKISAQLQRNREKLANLEKQYEERTAAKQKAIEQAEASAEKNKNAAVDLSNDAADRRKARRAEKSASQARRDTKSLQRADKNLHHLEKEIGKVKRQIEEGEKSLEEVKSN
jgi:hypothetical protein